MARLGLSIVWVLLGAGIAAGDARPTLVGAAGGKGDVALVGSLGEIYLHADGVWRRHGGGVAATLVRAWGTSAGEIWAVGTRPPAYAHDGKSWVALPGTSGASGPALLAEPGSPLAAVAIGRRVFVVERGKLAPAGAALPGLPTALWVSSTKDMAAIVDGKLVHHAAGWKPVVGADESLVALGPRLALGADGGVYAVDARLRKLEVEAALAGFKPRLVATPDAAAGRAAVVAGALGDGYAVAAVVGGRVALIGKLPGLARADEPVGLLSSGAEIIVVSRSGLVVGGDGKTWRTEAIATTVTETPHAAEPPAQIPVAGADAGVRP
jgi:hypothetical protein